MDLQGVFTGHFSFVNVVSCDGNWKGKTESGKVAKPGGCDLRHA